MSKIAFVFPGQGAQYVGMGKDFYEAYPSFRERMSQASSRLGFSMEALCFEEEEKLNLTEYTQCAMVSVCGGITDLLREAGIKPDVCAGLSLGEYAALYACGVFTFEDAVAAVRERGILMQNTVPAGVGSMAAIVGMSAEQVRQVCQETEGRVSIANDNCPGQLVITGEMAAVHEAMEKARAAGARRAVELKVSGPFHSELLIPAAEPLRQMLSEISLSDPCVPYVANVTASYVTDQKDVVDLLARQIYSPVRFRESVLAMYEAGVETFIEIGPGHTLSSMIRKTVKGVRTVSVEHVADLLQLKEEMGC